MDALRKEGNSIGARINVVATGVPPGLGEPIFDRLDADVAKAMMSIRKNQPDVCVRWLWLAIFAACLYLLTKHWEYQWKTEHGIGIKTNVFFGVY